jgi:hypothetical protein
MRPSSDHLTQFGWPINGVSSSFRLMLCGKFAVLLAPMLDGLASDPFALIDDGYGPGEMDVGRRYGRHCHWRSLRWEKVPTKIGQFKPSASHLPNTHAIVAH